MKDVNPLRCWTTRRVLGSLVLVALAVVGCATTRAAAPAPQAEPLEPALGADDVIEIHVVGEPSVSGLFRLAVDGSVDFPFVGRLNLNGLRPITVEGQIAQGLRKSGFQRPSVRVRVRERRTSGKADWPTPTPRRGSPMPVPEGLPSNMTMAPARVASAISPD